MARPREQAGGLAEASRLLQEGLQLLAEREREVDRLLEDARERALLIREEAEQRAAQITADAEQRRLEAEELVAGLRSEVEALRAELARLRSGAEPTPGPTSNNSEVGITGSAGVVESVQDPEPAVAPVASHEREHLDGPQSSESGEVIDAPRWGRPSSTVGGQQAVRAAKSSKPRWLPPWLPFTLTLVLAAALVGMNVSRQGGRSGDRV